MTPNNGGAVGFVIGFGGVCYRIRILMYPDVSCVKETRIQKDTRILKVYLDVRIRSNGNLSLKTSNVFRYR